MKSNQYSELINCETPEQVRTNIRQWTSNLSDNEHLIRSTILDIDAGIELLLKQIFFQQMSDILANYGNKMVYKQWHNQLWSIVKGLNFMAVHRILEPCLDSFDQPDLKHIRPIHDLRNYVVHQDAIGSANYKCGNPFKDTEYLARLFFEAWAARKALTKFYEVLIDDRRARFELYSKFYHENQEKEYNKKKIKTE